ncbi:DUF4129 domain-containing protein [Kitasatospora sp. NBC_01266]|uniref:DUF4129 domain-containing protein n=1 Tax=Kitasatospora sp. NBC_01266 TaxID=2903572 RepID=UPI002E35A1FE|nr:DUF4129 domain-containing protein [Kitasatospora sp. NBC_01266]
MPTWGDWVTAAGAPVTTPRDAAREAAREELLKPEYHRQDPSLLQRISSWLWGQLDHLLGRLGSTATSGTTGLILFLVIALLIGAALWWRLGRPGRSATSATTLFGADRPRTADQHRSAAQRHAAEGDFAGAVREQMRALVRSLEERALLDQRPGRTADEAAAEAGHQLPQHAAALREAARLFDDIAFGERAADQAAYRQLADLDQALRQTRPAALSPAGTG